MDEKQAPELSEVELARVQAFGLDKPEHDEKRASNIASHACGKTWKQRGNRTGHCGACHETFEGLSLFDAHQSLNPDGRVICADPATMLHRKQALRLVDGTWRGPSMPEGVFGDKGGSDA